jgi:hypothetical protein
VARTDIRCLHATLRSRQTLDAKAEHGRRARIAGREASESWHILRWADMGPAELDAEWRANSHEDGLLDVYGVPHPLVVDHSLQRALAPSLSRPRRLADAVVARVRRPRQYEAPKDGLAS